MSEFSIPPGARCKYCGSADLSITWRWDVDPPGTWSLAGVQSKVPARQVPWMRCVDCGASSKGKRVQASQED